MPPLVWLVVGDRRRRRRRTSSGGRRGAPTARGHARDLNAERYLAWRGRGRAAARPGSRGDDRATSDRISRGAALAARGGRRAHRLLRRQLTARCASSLLYADGDPAAMPARQNLVEVLTEDAFETPIQMIAVGPDADAELLGMRGSPTIRIDGTDIDPDWDGPIGLARRAYDRAGAVPAKATHPSRGRARPRLGPRAARRMIAGRAARALPVAQQPALGRAPRARHAAPASDAAALRGRHDARPGGRRRPSLNAGGAERHARRPRRGGRRTAPRPSGRRRRTSPPSSASRPKASMPMSASS